MRIKANKKELFDVQKNIKKHSEELETEIEYWQDQINELKNIWKGNDANIYYGKIDVYLEKLKMLSSCAMSLGDFINKEYEMYQSKDEEFSNALKRENIDYEILEQQSKKIDSSENFGDTIVEQKSNKKYDKKRISRSSSSKGEYFIDSMTVDGNNGVKRIDASSPGSKGEHFTDSMIVGSNASGKKVSASSSAKKGEYFTDAMTIGSDAGGEYFNDSSSSSNGDYISSTLTAYKVPENVPDDHYSFELTNDTNYIGDVLNSYNDENK